MSSLAGALDETAPSASYHVPKHEDDDASPEAGDDIEMADAEDQIEEKEEDQEMDDLFGQDEVDDVKPKYVGDFGETHSVHLNEKKKINQRALLADLRGC
jgi:hypothetical protein